MNPEIRGLLQATGVPGADDADLWNRMAMVHVMGLLPCPDTRHDQGAEAGFHLLLFERDGQTVQRVKCRSVNDAGFRRECETLVALGSDPELGGMVPRISTATSKRLRLHVSQHLWGPTYAQLIRRQSAEEWEHTAREILLAVHRIGVRGNQTLPWMMESTPEVKLLQTVKPRLDRLAERGLGARAVEVLRQTLEPLSAPRHLQHGDLWPGNVIQAENETWCILDYERFGLVQFPLYDTFHLFWSSSQITGRLGFGRRTRGRPAPSETDWHQACCGVLSEAAERHALSEEQVAGLILAFMIELTGHRMRKGTPLSYSEGLRSLLCHTAGRLESGLTLTELAEEWLP